jgi:hypothetical protein
MIARPAERRARSGVEFEELKKHVIDCILTDAPAEPKRSMNHAVTSAKSAIALQKVLHQTYAENNWIEFRATGRGMSRDDLLRAYLVIVTPSRRRDLDAALATGSNDAPSLGEKGVGRLSATRLAKWSETRVCPAIPRVRVQAFPGMPARSSN